MRACTCDPSTGLANAASCSQPSLPRLPCSPRQPTCCIKTKHWLHAPFSQLQGRPDSACRSTTTTATDAVQLAYERFAAPAAGAFSSDQKTFSEEHRIRGYEVRPDQRATIITMANLLQEVAGNHAVGMWGRAETGFANNPELEDIIFVMTRLQIRMMQYPRWGDIVKLETYFTEEGRLSWRREWKFIEASSGTVIGVATSSWVTINLATRRLAKVPDTVRNKFVKLTPPSSTSVLPAEETKRKLPEMTLPPQIEGPKQVARRSDMDMNGHINNATYLAWCLETVPEDVYEGYKLHEVEIDFKAECKAGQVVESLCNPLTEQNNGNGKHLQYLHALRACDQNGNCTELVRVRTTWVHK